MTDHICTIPCFTILFILFYLILFYSIPSYLILCTDPPYVRWVQSPHPITSYAILWHDMPCHDVLCCAVLCCILMWYRIMTYSVLFFFFLLSLFLHSNQIYLSSNIPLANSLLILVIIRLKNLTSTYALFSVRAQKPTGPWTFRPLCDSTRAQPVRIKIRIARRNWYGCPPL